MSRLPTPLLALLTVAGGLVLFLGGMAIGDVLRDERPAAATPVETIEVAAATPAEPDSGPDGPESIRPLRPSVLQLPAELVQVGDSGTALVAGAAPSDDAGDGAAPTDRPNRPPTVPGGLAEDGTGEPDPDAPFVLADGVELVEIDDVFENDDIFGDDPIEADGPSGGAGTGPGSLLGWLPFRDPCADVPEADAEAAEDACPRGIGGTILLIDEGIGPPAPLAITGQFYVGHGVPNRCSNHGTGTDGVFRPLLSSNNPADFTIRYWPSTRRSDVQEITYRTSDAERNLWDLRRIAGEPTWSGPHNGVHNCPGFPLPDLFPANGRFTFEITGVDDFGSTDSKLVYHGVDRHEGALGRPPVSFTPHPDGRRSVGVLAVPYDPKTELVYVNAIPRAGPRRSDQTCTDIEGNVLDRRQPLAAALSDYRIAPMVEPPGAPAYDPRFTHAVVNGVTVGEGSQVQLCVWIATPPRRSFDRPTVVQRDAIAVQGPRQLRVRVSVEGGHAQEALTANSVLVQAVNWDPWAAGAVPSRNVSAGRSFTLDEPILLFDSAPGLLGRPIGGSQVPVATVIEVRGPTGATQLLTVPTPNRCLDFGFTSSCPAESIERYDVPIPGPEVRTGLCGSSFGPCDPPTRQTFVGNLRLIVERYAGPAGAPTGGSDDGWQVHQTGAFPPSPTGRARPAVPQIDDNASSVYGHQTRGGARPGIHMDFTFDRPVRLVATPQKDFLEPCAEPAPYRSTYFSQTHSHRWAELCWGGWWSIALLAVDEDGNELDLRPIGADGTGSGHPGYGDVLLPEYPLREYTIDISVNRLGDGIQPQGVSGSVGGVAFGDFLAPGHPPRCVVPGVTNNTFSRVVRSDRGRPLTWEEPLVVSLTVGGTGDGRGCGLDATSRTIRLSEQVQLEDLLAGERTFVYDEPDGEITMTIRNVRD
jgi:hypothetical protein